MLLEKVASVEINYKSNYLYWVVGVISILIGLYFLSTNDTTPFLVMVVFGIIFIAVYFNTRKHFVTISSDGSSKLVFQTQGVRTDELIGFLDRIEKVKMDLSKT